MTPNVDHFGAACQCKHCAKKRKGWRWDEWQPITGAPEVAQQHILKLLGRLGRGPEHTGAREFRACWRQVVDLSGTLEAVERELAAAAPADMIVLERERDSVCESLVGVLPALLRFQPVTFRYIALHDRIADCLDYELLESLERQLDRVSKLKGPEVQRLELRRLELIEAAEVERQIIEWANELQAIYIDPTSVVEPWAVTEADWRTAFLSLAVKHGEPGFAVTSAPTSPHYPPVPILDGPDAGEFVDIAVACSYILGGDDLKRYSDLLHDLACAYLGEPVPIAGRLPHGLKPAVIEAAVSILAKAHRDGTWRPRQGGVPSKATLRAVFTDERAEWAKSRVLHGKSDALFWGAYISDRQVTETLMQMSK